jgi:hypothetical protein
MNINNWHKIQGMLVKCLITSFTTSRGGKKLQTHNCPKTMIITPPMIMPLAMYLSTSLQAHSKYVGTLNLLLLLQRYNSSSLGFLNNNLPFWRRSWKCSVYLKSWIFFISFLISSHRDLGLPDALPVNGFHLYFFFLQHLFPAFYLSVQTNLIFEI